MFASVLPLPTSGGMEWRTPRLDNIVDKIGKSKIGRTLESLFSGSYVTWQSILIALAAVIIAFILLKLSGSVVNFLTIPLKILILVAVAVAIFFLVNEVMK